MPLKRVILPTGVLLERNLERWRRFENTPFCLAMMAPIFVDHVFNSGLDYPGLMEITIEDLTASLMETDIGLSNPRHARIIWDPEFQTAAMDLWRAIVQHLDLVIDYRPPSGNSITGVSHHGWIGTNIVLAIELSPIGGWRYHGTAAVI